MERKKIELLAPAGDMERLQMAAAYGADAVYLAGTTFGMRSFAGNFTPEALKEAVELCHRRGIRVHVTCNTMPRNNEVARLPEWLEYLDSLGVDAIILADVGTLALAAAHAPHVERHISTQASVVNYQSARAWHQLGAKPGHPGPGAQPGRDPGDPGQDAPELELEVFAHGAMCVSYSGRCLLSNYMTGRDSNRGACAQPCRYQYALMEEKRPGEYFPVYEENGETYIMNSRDMCMIDHVGELMDAGLDSLKIGGAGQISLTTPPSSPELTATPSTPPGAACLWTPSGGMRWSTSATGTTPPVSFTASQASSQRIPVTSGTGRSPQRWSAVTRRAAPCSP